MNAIASEISMPMLALIGIGLMYGPISPVTNAIGSSAAMTVSVARIVGPPTSSTARGISSDSGASGCKRPMAVDVLDDDDRVVDQDADREDQREQRDAVQREAPGPRGEQRRGKRQDHREPTITASRRPSVTNTSATTDSVAKTSFWMSFTALSLAVSP